MHGFRSIAMALAPGVIVGSSASAGENLIGRASVIDGDTLEIRGQRIRLTGIDAPESSQTCEKGGKEYRCGQQAAFALSDKLGAKTVTCNSSGKDKYGRTLGQCFLGEEDINRWMVSQGQALAYRQYGSPYVAEEQAAHQAKRGMWAGTFKPGWEYRKERKEKAGTRPIKDVTKPIETQASSMGGSSNGRQCNHGKPCGNSCISVSKTCHK